MIKRLAVIAMASLDGMSSITFPAEVNSCQVEGFIAAQFKSLFPVRNVLFLV